MWPNMLIQMGLLRAGLAFMPTVTRNDQSVMYHLEHTVLDGLEAMQPGASENLYKIALMVAQDGGESANEKIHSRTSYFLTLTPAKRKTELGAILDTLLTIRAFNNPLRSMVFKPFDIWSEYPPYKW
ncbi:DUF6904 family protein [Pseudomonas chlororaphis]|uniref:DUF6904 family protein n=1 Tax=Pseudomonas chlororaphis TaxID=587753 RepID=UPI003F4FC173